NVVIEKSATDRPERHELTASPSSSGDDVMSAVQTDAKPKRGVPVVSIIFGGAAIAAGGVGAYFGALSRQSETAALAATDQSVRSGIIKEQNQQAVIADVLFGVAGAAALGAVIALFATPLEPLAESPR